MTYTISKGLLTTIGAIVAAYAAYKVADCVSRKFTDKSIDERVEEAVNKTVDYAIQTMERKQSKTDEVSAEAAA